MSIKTNQKSKFKLLDVVSLSLAHMLHDVFTSFLSPVLPLLISKLGIGYTAASLLSVVHRIPMLLNPILGMMADKAGVKYFVIFAPTITAISMSLIGIAPNYWILLLLLFISGISSAIFHVPSPVMIKQMSGNKTGMGMSFYMLGGELARTLGPLTIIGAISLWTFEGTWRLIPFALIISAWLFYRLRNIEGVNKSKTVRKETNYWEVFTKHKRVLIAIFGYLFFLSAIRSSITAFLPTFFSEKGESLLFGGSALAVYQLAGALGAFLAGTLSNKLGRKPTLVAIAILSPILMFLFNLFSGTPYSFVFLLMLGFVVIASGPVFLALVQDVKSEQPAFLNGIYMTINFLMGAIMLLFIGALGDTIGLERIYTVSVFIALPAIAFALSLPKG